jgi:hypothetical protein
MPRLPDKGGVGQSLYLDTGAPSGRNGYDESLRASLGLWRESEAFLRRQQRRSLKTQQRAFTSRPHRSFGTGEETNEPVTSLLLGMDFEHKLKEKKIAGET